MKEKKEAKVLSIQDFKDQKFLEYKYSEVRDMAARISAELMVFSQFVDENRLKGVKSNHRRERDLANLCKIELDAIAGRLIDVFSKIEVVEGEADVIDIKTRKKKQVA